MATTNVSLMAPAILRITDASGNTQVITIAAPPPVTPPVVDPPATGHAVASVVNRGSTDWIMRRDNIRLDITALGAIRYGGLPIPGSENSIALGYDPATNTTYRRVAGYAAWIRWGGSMTTVDWAPPATPWLPPGVAPPVVPPVVPPVTSSPRQKVLDLLASIKGKGWILGQMCHNNFSEDGMNREAGVRAGWINTDLYMDFQTQISDGAIPKLIEAWKSGHLVGCSAFMPNPISGSSTLDKAGINAGQMITPGTSQYNAFIAQTDKIIAALKPADDAGVPLLHRMFWEADMGAFWYSIEGQFTVAQYQELYRIYAARVRAALKHVIMMWSTNGNRTDHYPAAARPEVIGWDYYGNRPDERAGHYNALRQIAQANPGTHIMMAEFGSGDPSNGDGSFNCQVIVDAIKNVMPDVCGVLAWSGDPRPGGWHWGRLSNLAALKQPTVFQLGGFKLL